MGYGRRRPLDHRPDDEWVYTGQWIEHAYSRCSRAFSAAIALRALLDESERISRDIYADNEKLRAERDAALARAEIAVAFNLRMVNKLRIETDKRPIALPGAPYLLDELIEQLYRTERECAALTARLVKLQAVCDAAVEWSVRASDLDTIWTQYNREKYDKAEKELLAALAALASGAESEVTK